MKSSAIRKILRGNRQRWRRPDLRMLIEKYPDLSAVRVLEELRKSQPPYPGTRVAIVGSDVPALTRETTLRALEALTLADVVLGPAEDGGYYLIALRAPHPELVRGIDWSTPAVLRQTLERAAAAGLVVHQLEPLRDVDTLEDLRCEWPRLETRFSDRPELLQALGRALGLPG